MSWTKIRANMTLPTEPSPIYANADEDSVPDPVTGRSLARKTQRHWPDCHREMPARTLQLAFAGPISPGWKS